MKAKNSHSSIRGAKKRMARSFKLKKSRTAEKKPSKKEKKDKEKAKDKMKKKTKKKVAAIESLSGETVGSEEEDSSSSEEEKPAPETIKPVPLTLADRGPEKKVLPGATSLPAPILPSYTRRILMEERPDLFSNEEKTDMEETELDLLDKYVRDRAELKGDDLIVTDDNFDEEERCFVRYEVQLKYNEGRYSAIYIVSKQICKDNVMKDACGLFALKTGLRNGSSTFGVKIKREIRILSEMSKAKQSWAPHYFQCGSVCDMPFIIMALVDMNVEKLRELLGGKFKPASGFYIAGEILNALTDLHSRGFVHRDVKPTNICVGVGTQASRIFLIDYGDTIRIGKKIKYSVADAYTLPYWSLDAHEKKPATEKTDIEAWFYTTLDLIPPDVITWKTELSESEVHKAKKNFWTDIQNNMPHCSPSLISVAETISTAENKIDVAKLKSTLKSGFQQAVGTGKKYVPEWEKTINTAITTTPAATKTKITPKEAGTAVRTAT